MNHFLFTFLIKRKILPVLSWIIAEDYGKATEKNYLLRTGDGIVIPAHASHCFNANEQFKMISTVIKSGYED